MRRFPLPTNQGWYALFSKVETAYELLHVLNDAPMPTDEGRKELDTLNNHFIDLDIRLERLRSEIEKVDETGRSRFGSAVASDLITDLLDFQEKAYSKVDKLTVFWRECSDLATLVQSEFADLAFPIEEAMASIRSSFSASGESMPLRIKALGKEDLSILGTLDRSAKRSAVLHASSAAYKVHFKAGEEKLAIANPFKHVDDLSATLNSLQLLLEYIWDVSPNHEIKKLVMEIEDKMAEVDLALREIEPWLSHRAEQTLDHLEIHNDYIEELREIAQLLSASPYATRVCVSSGEVPDIIGAIKERPESKWLSVVQLLTNRRPVTAANLAEHALSPKAFSLPAEDSVRLFERFREQSLEKLFEDYTPNRSVLFSPGPGVSAERWQAAFDSLTQTNPSRAENLLGRGYVVSLLTKTDGEHRSAIFESFTRIDPSSAFQMVQKGRLPEDSQVGNEAWNVFLEVCKQHDDPLTVLFFFKNYNHAPDLEISPSILAWALAHPDLDRSERSEAVQIISPRVKKSAGAAAPTLKKESRARSV